MPERRRRGPDLLPLLRLCLLLLTLPAAGAALARDHHVALPDAAPAARPDGSAEAPWPSVGAALDSRQLEGGDRLLLAPGAHGALRITDQDFAPPLEITSAPGGRAHLSRIRVAKSSGLVFRDLSVWPLTPNPPDSKTRPAVVATAGNTRRIVFDGLDIMGGPDGRSYLNWDKADWRDRWTSEGVALSGQQHVLRNSQVTAVSNGITTLGDQVRVLGNTVRGFSRDGMRGLGANSVFSGNRVMDCVKVGGNHDDGFQAWAPRGRPTKENRKGPTLGPLVGLVFENNMIVEWTGPADHPLRCSLQGIAMFSGPYEGLSIRNNLIVVSAFHGITVYRGTSGIVANNTVLSPQLGKEAKTWISQKNAGPGLIFANNVAPRLKLGEVRQSRNAKAVPLRMFENPAALNFTPRANGGLVDVGDPAFAPSTDMTGRPRPQGPGPDIGALERP